MDALLTYVIQVSILLVIVYGGYYLLLRKLTFYSLNRGYFILGLVFSFVYPFMDLRSLFQEHVEPLGDWVGYLPEFYVVPAEHTVFTLEHALYVVIGLGMLGFALRLCVQLLSFWRIHRHSQDAVWKTYWYRNVLFPVVPFSFLNKIYVHEEQHGDAELHDIFEHEHIHVKGLHSVDMLMFEMLLVVCWYNPFVWLMRKAVRQNLEYLTDQQVLNKGVDRQMYQYALLQVSKQGVSIGLSNQFNVHFLKKRIMMMNKKRSSKLQWSKYAFLLPAVIFSAGAFTVSKADAKIAEVVDVAKETTLGQRKLVVYETAQQDSLADVQADGHKADAVRQDSGGLRVIGKKGKGVRVTIRDVDTVTKDSARASKEKGKELYVIDDVVQEGKTAAILKDMDPKDIESISVFKGAAALEKYGKKGENGVVVISTKAYVEMMKKEGARVWTLAHKREPLVDPMYLVDGKVLSKKEFSALTEDQKKSIVTLSKEEAKDYFSFYNYAFDLGTHDGVVAVTTK